MCIYVCILSLSPKFESVIIETYTCFYILGGKMNEL
jgi:hypothetical protein